jgi:hypothetical protein
MTDEMLKFKTNAPPKDTPLTLATIQAFRDMRFGIRQEV